MSLKVFHIVFIAASIALMTFLSAWAWRMGQIGLPHPGLLASGVTGFALALAYLGWFVKRYRFLP